MIGYSKISISIVEIDSVVVVSRGRGFRLSSCVIGCLSVCLKSRLVCVFELNYVVR